MTNKRGNTIESIIAERKARTRENAKDYAKLLERLNSRPPVAVRRLTTTDP